MRHYFLASTQQRAALSSRQQRFGLCIPKKLKLWHLSKVRRYVFKNLMEQPSSLPVELCDKTHLGRGVVGIQASHSRNNAFTASSSESSTADIRQLSDTSKEDQSKSNPCLPGTHSSDKQSDIQSISLQVNKCVDTKFPGGSILQLRQGSTVLTSGGVQQRSENAPDKSIDLVGERNDRPGVHKNASVEPIASPAQQSTNLSVQEISVLEIPKRSDMKERRRSEDPSEAESDLPVTSMRSLRTKRSFTTEFKLECVEHAERTNNKTKTAKLFNVNRRRVQEWCTQKERLMAVPKQQKRLSGGGRRQIPLSSSPQIVLAENESTGAEDKEKGPFNIVDLRQAPSQTYVAPIPILDPSFVDIIVQSLPTMDFSVLPSGMAKVIQDWSKLVMAQGGKLPSLEDLGLNNEQNAEQPAPSSLEQPAPSSLEQPAPSSLEQPAPSSPVLPAPSSSEEFATRLLPNKAADEINVEDSMDVEPAHNSDYVVNNSADSSKCERFPDTVSQQLLNSGGQVKLSEQSEGEVSESSQLEQGNCDIVESQETDISNGSKDDILCTSQIDAKGGIDLNSISNWIHENALEGNVSAILDALMHAQAIASKPGSDDFSETSMEANTGADETDVQQPVKRARVSRSPSSVRPRVKNRYSLEFKLECIAHAESTSKCAAAREFNVDRRRVQDWCSKKDQLRKMIEVSGQAVVKMTRERIDSDVEQELVAWVKFQQEAGVVLNRKMLGEEATRLYHEKGETDFVSSVGWVAKFMVRNNISLVGRSLRIRTPESNAVAAS